MRSPVIITTFACLIAMQQARAVTVIPSDNGTSLANLILGSGITLSGSPVYSPAGTGASGSFNGGLASGIGINSGLILTTGLAINANGPNNQENTSGPGAHTQLDFSFTSNSGDLYFNYVFASEEYKEYVGSIYNDSFRFLLDGVNIALIPGTSTPVAINNVNQYLNSSLFNDNTAGIYDIEYDGFTDVFQAKALGIGAGTHTISLIIDDVGDQAWDSAVFIQGGSFSDSPVDPGHDVPDSGQTIILLGSSLLGFGILRRFLAAPANAKPRVTPA